MTLTADGSGGRQVVLKDLSFGTGVGWYVEKSIRLDATQLEALMRSLCACRQHPSTRPVENVTREGRRGTAPTEQDAKIVAFPELRSGS